MVTVFDLEAYREDRKQVCTAEELANRLNMPHSKLINIEHGRRKNVPMDEYKKICEAAGLSFEDYLREIEENPVVYKKPIVITFLTNKGGAGKTSAAVNLAGALVNDYNKKCLVIDSDSQQNTTMHLGMLFPIDDTPEEIARINEVYEESKTKNIYQAIINKDDIQNHILKTQWENLDIVMSCDDMSTMDMKMFTMQLSELRVQNILNKLINENPNGYDFIIFDCNPVLSQMNVSVLFATDYVIIPLEAAPFGLRGVQNVLNFVDDIRKQREELKTLGILLNKYDQRKNITKDVSAALFSVDDFSEKIFDTKIPVDTSIENSQGFGEPLFVSFKKSNAYNAYKSFANEVLERIEG